MCVCVYFSYIKVGYYTLKTDTHKESYVTDFFRTSRNSWFMKGLKSASKVGQSIFGHF